MKRILFLFLIGGVQFLGLAQSPTLKMGPTIKGSPLTNIIRCLGITNDGVYTLRGDEENSMKWYLEKYGPVNNELLSSNEIILPKVNGKDLRLEKGFMQKGQIIVIGAANDNTNEKRIYYMAVLTPVGKISVTPTEVFSVPRKWGQQDFIFEDRISADRSKVAFCYSNRDDKAQLTTIYLKVMDGLSVLKEFSVKYPFKSKDNGLDVVNYAVTNSGNVYLLGKYGSSLKDEDRFTVFNRIVFPAKDVSADFVLLGTGDKNGEFKETRIGLDQNYVSDVFLALDRSQNPFIAGLYSKYSSKSVGGIFFGKPIPAAGEFKPKVQAFSEEILSQYIDLKKVTKPEERELGSLFFKRILFANDGGIYITAETISSTVIRPSEGSNYTVFFYQDILAVRLNEKNELSWGKRIPKFQECSPSFAAVTKGSDLLLIYDDNSKNLTVTDPGKIKTALNSKNSIQTVAVEVTPSGSVTKSLIADNKDLDVMIEPGFPLGITDNEVFVMGENQRKVAFGVIHY